MISHDSIVAVIIDCINQLNLARTEEKQLEAGANAAIFGEGSSLDSMGLVSLVIDVEQALEDEGCEISLSDEKTMSQRSSPFRTVQTLAAYIHEKATQENAG